MPEQPEQVLSDFIDAWNAGGRPRVRDYLARVPEAERDALADEISTWLEDRSHARAVGRGLGRREP